MSQINIPVTQLAQLGFADRIAHEAQGHPEIARQAAQQATPEVLKQQRDKVDEPQGSEASKALKSEKDGKGSQGGAGDNQRKKGEPPPEETESASNSPWAGNILNLKV